MLDPSVSKYQELFSINILEKRFVCSGTDLLLLFSRYVIAKHIVRGHTTASKTPEWKNTPGTVKRLAEHK